MVYQCRDTLDESDHGVPRSSYTSVILVNTMVRSDGSGPLMLRYKQSSYSVSGRVSLLVMDPGIDTHQLCSVTKVEPQVHMGKTAVWSVQ